MFSFFSSRNIYEKDVEYKILIIQKILVQKFLLFNKTYENKTSN